MNLEVKCMCNEEDRVLTKFEKQSLKDWWFDNSADEYSVGNNELEYEKWEKNLSWNEVDNITKHYINEN
jgi:hypothetical protein